MDFKWFMNMELNDKLTSISITVTILLALIPVIYKIIIVAKDIKKWRDREIRRRLDPDHSDGLKLLRKSNHFIPIYGQLEAPHNSDEILVSDKRFLLTKKFINENLNPNVIGKKRYLILGGSGMGKSTFSADLVCQYINKYNPRNIPFPINILYLGDSDVFDKIIDLSKKQDACESILILDALDENVDATKDISSFWNKLDIITNIFKFVIITGRTQLFQDEASEPGKGSKKQNSNTSKRLIYERIYISPFSPNEIRTYLANKFSVGTENYCKAIQIVNKGNDLMSRPMILSFINDLLGFAQYERLSIAEIYKKIIDEWLKRECDSQEDSDSLLNVADLYTFSKKLAVYMYYKWEETGTSHLAKEEYDFFIESYGYSTNPYSFKDRSLINRKSDGSIKFSHKSFWEFFIAIDVIENPGKSYNPEKLDMAKKFTDELNNLYLQGNKLNYINYFEYNCTTFTKEELKELKSFFEKLKKDFQQKEDIKHLYCLWYNIQDYIFNLLLTDSEIHLVGNSNSIQMLMSSVSNLLYKYNASKFIHQIQEYLYKKDLDYKSVIETLECDLMNIGKHINDNTYPNILFPVYKKPKVVFSNLYAYNKKFIEDILSQDIICIGSGFYNNHSTYNLVVKILRDNPNISLMNIIKNCTSLEDATGFISELTEKIKNSRLTIHGNIAVSFEINKTRFIYVLNSFSLNNTLSQTNACLSKMYYIKSEKSTS